MENLEIKVSPMLLIFFIGNFPCQYTVRLDSLEIHCSYIVFKSDLLVSILRIAALYYCFLFPFYSKLRIEKCFLLGPPRNRKNTDYPWAS